MLDLKNIRNENLSQILFRLHFHGAKRRAALSQELGIRLNSMNSLMEELQEKGLIEPVDPNRARSAYKIDGSHHWCLGIKTARAGVLAQAIRLDGTCLFSKHIDRHQWKVKDFCLEIKDVVADFSKRLQRKPLGIGVAMTGIVADGEVKRSLQFGPWHKVALRESLEKQLRLKVVVENDTRCALIGEQWFHLKDEARSSIFAVSLGFGVSSAMILKGELHVGGQSAAGEIGHVPVENVGRPCLCGKFDCLEAYCKTDEILKQVNEVLDPHATGEGIVHSLDELVEKISENPGINNVIDRISQLLCKVLVPIVAALDTDTLMVISESEPFSSLISEALNRHFDQRLIGHEAHGIRWLARGDLSNSNCRGAAALLIQEVFRNGGETSDLSA